MKKIVLGLCLFFFWTAPALATEKVNLYFFYGQGCPHCGQEEKFLDQLERENPNIVVHRYEVWHNRANEELLGRIGRELDLRISGVPVLIVGEETIVGFFSAETTGEKIRRLVMRYVQEGCRDLVAPIVFSEPVSDQCVHGCAAEDEDCRHECGCAADVSSRELPETIALPVIGEVEVKNLSLPLLTFVVAGADGFNPCAMWVLLFLISLLLGMKNRRRMWLLGTVFILTSGAVYFLFLAAWLNLFLFLGVIVWLRLLIGLVALASGGLHLRSWFKERAAGCEVVSDEKKKKVFLRMRAIVNEKKIYFALAGIIVLGAFINLIELLCSAGLPAVYTQVLSLSDLPGWAYYFYLVAYVFIYMLDDMLLFILAMATLEMRAVESRYTRFAGLVGGVAMIVIGLLLIFRPGWIMFG